ncbi:AraC family transcriptional regulator [Phaeobacter inhibens]|uniref:AraC family transcriptional regulator n=1 Tax=Phaeobacter inhibens TaxID=221822 RepID=UPI0021A2D106|nr:helix-turn-helix domain-containing protein [Phaeobacter inhibens]UWR43626.1 helix-turn-helix domain-containing protein [Phaeobacter inhibens]
MIPAYQELPVPETLRASVRRIMRVEIDVAQNILIPARPTGFTYIGWFSKGTGSATANDVRFKLQAGQIHFSGQLSTFDAQFTLHGPCVQYLAELAPDALYRFLQDDIGALCNRLEMRQGPAQTALSEDQTFIALLTRFHQTAGETVPEIAKAAAHIEAAYGNISIADLTAQSCMTERQFRRSFTKVVGLSPKSFANIRRVLHALSLMSDDPNLGLADVANEAGFYDQAHLTRAFNQYLRATPAKLAFDNDGVLRSIVAGAS